MSTLDYNEVYKILSKTNKIYLFIAISLIFPIVFIKSYRWKKLLNEQNIIYPLPVSFIVYLSSLFIGFITPGRLGEFVKVIYLKADKGISLSKGFSSVVIDRILDLYFLAIFGFFGLWHFNIMHQISFIFVIISIIIYLIPFTIFNQKLMKNIINILYKNTIFKRVNGKLNESYDDFYCGIMQLVNIRILFSIVLTSSAFILFFMQCYLIAIAMNISISFYTVSIFMAISSLISFIPISISGLGTRDVTLVYLFSLIGLKQETAVIYAFLVFFIFFVCGGMIGALAFWVKPLNKII